MSAAVDATTQQQLVGDELKQAIKRQVEFYFSKTNLATDAFLVSQMNSQMYVPVDVIVGFSKVKQLTENTALIVEAIRDSSLVALNSTGDAIKPNIKSERNTIILREIPSATKPEDVEAIFAGCGGEVASVRSDVGDTWFVTMASEEDAVSTLLALRSKTFNGAPIKARLKSENALKSFFPSQPAESAVVPGAYGGRGYYGAAPVGYYDVPNNYGVQYNSVNSRGSHSNGAENRYTQRGPGGRGAAAGAGQYRQNQGGRGGQGAPQQQPKEGRAKSGSFDQQRAPASKKGKDKKTSGAKQPAAQQPASNGTPGKKSAPATERQPILSASNFPPLPTDAAKPDANAPIQHSYHHEDIMEIVKNMDETDCTLPEGKMDFDTHPAALTSVAHPDLLRNQRTYSIEQAREAMRQGRPIRSDSVGSIDYESMMYGEDYTKEARELRKQNSEEAAAGKDASPAKDASPKVFSFASAVIHGTPAPVDVVAAKKKPVAAAAAAGAEKAKTPKSSKDDKKTGKKGGKAPDSKKTAVVDETLPKSGAWGGRNFLDVVKSEPAVAQPPAAPASQEAAKNVERKDSKPKASK